MPWDVRENYGGCNGFAVVKIATGEVEGCHTDKTSADQQVAALYAAEGADPMQAAATDEMKKKRRRAKQEYDENGNLVVNLDPEFVPDTTFIPVPGTDESFTVIKRDDGGMYIQ